MVRGAAEAHSPVQQGALVVAAEDWRVRGGESQFENVFNISSAR